MGSAAHISWFADIGLVDRAHVGGKGGSLGELQRAGIAVPPGFIVRTGAFEGFLAALERDSLVRRQVGSLDADDLEGITACSKAIRLRLEQAALPPEVLEELSAARAKLCGTAGAPTSVPAVAVRSSATTEDAHDASFAGLQ